MKRRRDRECCCGDCPAASTSCVTDQGNVSPVVILLGQEWCWIGRVWRTAAFPAVLLEGDWVRVSIFLARSAFFITAALSEKTGPVTTAEECNHRQRQSCYNMENTTESLCMVHAYWILAIFSIRKPVYKTVRCTYAVFEEQLTWTLFNNDYCFNYWHYFKYDGK